MRLQRERKEDEATTPFRGRLGQVSLGAATLRLVQSRAVFKPWLSQSCRSSRGGPTACFPLKLHAPKGLISDQVVDLRSNAFRHHIGALFDAQL